MYLDKFYHKNMNHYFVKEFAIEMAGYLSQCGGKLATSEIRSGRC